MSQFKIKSKPRLSADQIAQVAAQADQAIEVPDKPAPPTESVIASPIAAAMASESMQSASRQTFIGLDPDAKPDARLAVNARMNHYEMAVIKFFADRDKRSQAYIFRQMLRIGMQQLLADLDK